MLRAASATNDDELDPSTRGAWNPRAGTSPGYHVEGRVGVARGDAAGAAGKWSDYFPGSAVRETDTRAVRTRERAGGHDTIVSVQGERPCSCCPDASQGDCRATASTTGDGMDPATRGAWRAWMLLLVVLLVRAPGPFIGQGLGHCAALMQLA